MALPRKNDRPDIIVLNNFIGKLSLYFDNNMEKFVQNKLGRGTDLNNIIKTIYNYVYSNSKHQLSLKPIDLNDTNLNPSDPKAFKAMMDKLEAIFENQNKSLLNLTYAYSGLEQIYRDLKINFNKCLDELNVPNDYNAQLQKGDIILVKSYANPSMTQRFIQLGGLFKADYGSADTVHAAICIGKDELGRALIAHVTNAFDGYKKEPLMAVFERDHEKRKFVVFRPDDPGVQNNIAKHAGSEGNKELIKRYHIAKDFPIKGNTISTDKEFKAYTENNYCSKFVVETLLHYGKDSKSYATDAGYTPTTSRHISPRELESYLTKNFSKYTRFECDPNDDKGLIPNNPAFDDQSVQLKVEEKRLDIKFVNHLINQLRRYVTHKETMKIALSPTEEKSIQDILLSVNVYVYWDNATKTSEVMKKEKFQFEYFDEDDTNISPKNDTKFRSMLVDFTKILVELPNSDLHSIIISFSEDANQMFADPEQGHRNLEF